MPSAVAVVKKRRRDHSASADSVVPSSRAEEGNQVSVVAWSAADEESYLAHVVSASGDILSFPAEMEDCLVNSQLAIVPRITDEVITCILSFTYPLLERSPFESARTADVDFAIATILNGAHDIGRINQKSDSRIWKFHLLERLCRCPSMVEQLSLA